MQPSASLAGLDAEQRLAAGAHPRTRQIVLAAPGSGKTEVVAALVGTLDDEHGLDSVDEVLVLSFSRAAVSALRSRLGPRARGPLPGIRTIDSLASRLLEDFEESGWEQLDFDGRISRATASLQRGARSEDLALLSHVVVDEVQDLVGLRADFVLELLRALPDDAGFTLLGDPRQALYDFQLGGSHDTTSRQFLDRAGTLGEVEHIRLRGQYRARSSDALGVAALGASDLKGSAWDLAVQDQLDAVLTMGEVADVARPVSRWSGTTAFLCRTNGAALVTARRLHDSGVVAGLRPRAEASPVEPWVARALIGSGRVASRAEVEERLHDIGFEEPGAAWRLLKATERDRRSGDRIDIARLAARIDVGDFPSALSATPGPTVVSTVHRAKGLEFDNVVIVGPNDLRGDAVPTMYVALTRARSRIVAAGLQRPAFLRLDPTTNRWIIGGYQRWMTTAFEVRGEDVEPISGNEIPEVGSPVVAALDRSASSLDTPVWRLRSGVTDIGRTTPEFGSLIARRVSAGQHRSGWGWPDLEAGLVVESVATGVIRDGQGRGELALVPRVSGLAQLGWS